MTAPFEPSEMVDYAEQIAREMVTNMPDKEATHMVRDFVRVMADWQPEVYRQLDDPTLLAITSLTTSKLFELAFMKAYKYREKHVQAKEAIEKAFGGLS
jgi:hypothetical protein